jgi:hypothetical protein
MTYEPGWIPQAFTFLRRDDLPALFEHLYSLISNGGQHVEIRSPIEQRDGVPWCQPGQANLLWLIRDMLVREDGGTLTLAGACPREWLAPGRRIAIADLPTHFGAVSFEVKSSRDGRAITATFKAKLREQPERVRLRLRRPDGALPKAVAINGQPTEQQGSEWLSLPAEACKVRVEY